MMIFMCFLGKQTNDPDYVIGMMKKMSKTKKPDVKETTIYESCIDYKSLEAPADLGSLFSEEEISIPDDDKHWKKHWVGMPEFIQPDNPPNRKLIINFRTEEDFAEFAKLIDQNLSDKTKSIWYPHLDKDQNSLKRWIEIDE